MPLDLLITVDVLAGRHVVQAWSEVHQRPAPLLLKPEQDYLHFKFPNTLSLHGGLYLNVTPPLYLAFCFLTVIIVS